MTTGMFQYNISIQVGFTPDEAKFLVERAQRHYDATCQAAGSSYEDGARENGFIKQLVLFPRLAPFWTTRQLDLTLKVLEVRDLQPEREVVRARLFNEVKDAFDAIQDRYEEL